MPRSLAMGDEEVTRLLKRVRVSSYEVATRSPCRLNSALEMEFLEVYSPQKAGILWVILRRSQSLRVRSREQVAIISSCAGKILNPPIFFSWS